MFNTKKETYMLKRILIYSLFLCAIITGLAACGASDPEGAAGDNAPALADCTVDAGCDGGENDQYVDVIMRFDRGIKYGSGLTDELRVVIGGERVKNDKISVSQDDTAPDEIKLRISIDKVTNGVIEITSSDGKSALKSITDDSGKYGAQAPDIKKLIPSGVAIEQAGASGTGEQPEWTKIKVTSPPSHRSMVWIQLLKNGEVVPPDDLSSPDILDDSAAGIHEHEFLWATEESVAENIAKAVNDFYGKGFKAESSGSEVTVTALDAADGQQSGGLELRLYEY